MRRISAMVQTVVACNVWAASAIWDAYGRMRRISAMVQTVVACNVWAASAIWDAYGRTNHVYASAAHQGSA
jgi:hypothetical protein